jgi:YD repeat-containing protein
LPVRQGKWNVLSSRARDLSDLHWPDQIFTYDCRDRLLTAASSDMSFAQTYLWDGNDNLRSIRGGGNPTTDYFYDGHNLLTSIATNGQAVHSYQYDPRGLPAARDGSPIGLDSADRLASLGSSGTFTYDGANRRLKSVVGGTTTYFAYTADGRLMWTYDPSVAMGTSYVYIGSRLVALNGDNGSRVLGDSSAPVQLGNHWYFSGYACSTGVPEPIAVRLYTNDSQHQLVGSFMADVPSDDDVHVACKTSAQHGFHIELTDALRQTFQGRALIAYGVDYYDGSEGHVPHSEFTMPDPDVVALPDGASL